MPTFTGTITAFPVSTNQLYQNDADATRDPTGSDNFAAGYSLRMRWLRTDTEQEWVCTGDGQWTEVTGGTTTFGGLTDVTIAGQARGDVIKVDAAGTGWENLAIGAANTVLRTDGTDPNWGKVAIGTDVSGLGTGIAAALAVNVGSAGAPVLFDGALGTPLTGTLTNATGLPIVAGTTGTLSILRGGTGETTQQAAIDALTAVSGATSAHVLTKDGSGNATFQAADGGDFSDGGEAGGADRTLGNTDNFAMGILTNNVERLRVQADGKVVLGSFLTAPDTPVEIETTSFRAFRIERTTPSGGAAIVLESGNNEWSQLALLGDGTFSIYNTAAGTAGPNRVLNVSRESRVGVGVTFPLVDFQISGSTIYRNAGVSMLQLASSPGVFFEDADDSNAYVITGNNGRIKISAKSGAGNIAVTDEKMSILTSGYVGIGNAAPATLLDALLADAVTGAVSSVATLGHDSSGTPAAGFGGRLALNLESSTTPGQQAAGIVWEWQTATHASRVGDLTLNAYNVATAHEGLRIRGGAAGPEVGIYGAAPVARATTGGAASTFAANTSGIADDTATWDSYTIGTVVKALRNVGILT